MHPSPLPFISSLETLAALPLINQVSQLNHRLEIDENDQHTRYVMTAVVSTGVSAKVAKLLIHSTLVSGKASQVLICARDRQIRVRLVQGYS